MSTNSKNTGVCEERVYQPLYNEHFTSIRNFIYYKNGDIDKAEDMAQDCFITMWKHCKDVVIEKAKGYLLTVANRLFLNDVRHSKVKLNFTKQIQPLVDKQDPEFIHREKEFKATLENAIAELSEKQREVFLMNRIDKMTFKEIAEQLDISVKAVEKRMHTSLKALKNKVSELKDYKF